VPALVPLVSDDPRVTELTGIAVQDVVASLLNRERKLLGRRRRPVLRSTVPPSTSHSKVAIWSRSIARPARRDGGRTR